MTMPTQLKAQLQSRISSVTGSTTDEELLRLAAIARSEPFDTTALDAQIAARSAAVTAGTSLAVLYMLAAANGEPRDVPVGSVIRASASLPAVLDNRYIAAGNFVTAGFSPKLKDMYDNFFGYKASDGQFTGGSSDYTRGFDTDGAGTIIMPSGAGELLRSADNGLTWTDIKTLVGWASTTVGAIKHISGSGNTGTWLIQHVNGTGYKSTDGGATWSNVNTLIAPSTSATFLAASPSGQHVIAKGYQAATILRSTDWGATFNQQSLSGTSAQVFCVTHVTGGIFVAAGCYQSGGYPCYWLSTDNGVTWSAPVIIDNSNTGAVYSVCYAPKYDRVYFGGFSSNKLAAIKAVSTGEPVLIPSVVNILLFTSGSNYLGLAATDDGFLFCKSGNNNGFIHKEVSDESTLIGKAPIMPNLLGLFGGVVSDGAKFYARSSSVSKLDVFQHAVGLYPNNINNALPSNETQFMRWR